LRHQGLQDGVVDIVLAWEDTPGPPIRYTRISKPIVAVLIVLLEHSAAKNANLIEIGMRPHVQGLPSGESGVVVAVVEEISLGMMMTGDPTGIGIGIAQGVMRTTMVVPAEVVAAGLTVTDLMITGRAVTAIHLRLVMHYLPSSSIMSLLQPHL
jgi:hypothetical protein